MRPLHELIDHEEPAWPIVQEWVAAAANPVEMLAPPEQSVRENALHRMQVTTRSPMGAVIYNSGGILVDHGWLRLLGAGHPRLPRSLPGWNQGRTFDADGQRPAFLLVADDVVGGFFALDGGGLGFGPGSICYFAPGTLAWESTDFSYSGFLQWCCDGDLARYYEDVRWPGWQADLGRVSGDQAFGIYPLLSCDGPPVAERNRAATSVAEIYDLHVGHSQR